MPTSRSPSPAELLLQLLELMSLGATRPEQATKQLRRGYRFAGLARRIDVAIETLVSEDLIEQCTDDRGRVQYRTTASGLATLERRGRFPDGAAVLFTDIVGSTELIDAFGETGAHRRRQRHFTLLREEIECHGGREVKSLGDGLMVIFADSANAAACAVAMQRSVDRDRDRLGLRIGLHRGELLREGDDFFGTTVIVARRLCEVAGAGQIVVSDEMLDAIDDLASGVGRDSLGPIALKGLSEQISASSLLWSEDRALRSGTPTPTGAKSETIAVGGGE